MKYKKYSYIIVIALMILIGINNVGAEVKNCYYMSNNGNYKATLTITYGNDGTKEELSLDKFGENNYMLKGIHLQNWWGNNKKCIKGKEVCFDTYHKNKKEANKFNGKCPNYLVYQNTWGRKAWVTESETLAEKAVNELKKKGISGFYASSKNGTLTAEEYYSEFIAEGIVKLDPNGEVSCADYENIFGDKDDPESIRYILNEVLQYVRIIVPILIILLGVIDFSKAVLAAKEDNMKKAQTDFIKRLVIGVAVFFVPLLVDLVMWLADIVWGQSYPHCGL